MDCKIVNSSWIVFDPQVYADNLVYGRQRFGLGHLYQNGHIQPAFQSKAFIDKLGSDNGMCCRGAAHQPGTGKGTGV